MRRPKKTLIGWETKRKGNDMTNGIKGRISLLVTLTLLIFAFSCAGVKVEQLNDTIDKYNRALKWGGYQASAPLIDESVRQKLLAKKLKEMQDKNIVEYSLADLSISQDQKTATAVVQYSYIDQKTQSVHGFGELQVWKMVKGEWFLANIIESKDKPGSDIKHSDPEPDLNY